jgi:glutaredoxin 3
MDDAPGEAGSNQQPRVIIYGTEFCPYCTAARMLLKKKGVNFEDILVSGDNELRQKMERLSGGRTVPQIFFDDKPIGGFDDLYSMEQDGRLDELLGQSAADQA